LKAKDEALRAKDAQIEALKAVTAAEMSGHFEGLKKMQAAVIEGLTKQLTEVELNARLTAAEKDTDRDILQRYIARLEGERQAALVAAEEFRRSLENSVTVVRDVVSLGQVTQASHRSRIVGQGTNTLALREAAAAKEPSPDH